MQSPLSYLDPSGQFSCSVSGNGATWLVDMSSECRTRSEGFSAEEIEAFKVSIVSLAAKANCLQGDCEVSCEIDALNPNFSGAPDVNVVGTGCPPNQVKMLGRWDRFQVQSCICPMCS
jgi:hypothetical protein